MNVYMSEWKRVVMAWDCEPCDMCGEPVCPVCKVHYHECECPGPDQDDIYEYRMKDEILYAKKLDTADSEG